MHERREYFEGLEEWILIHKSATEFYCVREDGRRQDCTALRKEDRAAHYSKWGAMSKALGLKVMPADDATFFEAHVTYRVEVPEKMEGAAREKFFADVRAGGDQLATRILEGGGAVIVPANNTMPELTMRGSAQQIRALAWSPDIVLIRERIQQTGNSGRYADFGPTQSVSYAEVHSAFNDQGSYGAGQKIGILGAAPGCGLLAEHEAFAHSTIHEFEPPQLCQDDWTCPCHDGIEGRCSNGTCIDTHETGVASVISASRDDGQYGASQAELYHYNGSAGGQGGSACDPLSARTAYDWFVLNGVHIVNESFICFQPTTQSLTDGAYADGYVQDYYSRVFNIFIARAAGNDGQATREEQGTAPACPYTLNAMCVGGVDDSDACVIG